MHVYQNIRNYYHFVYIIKYIIIYSVFCPVYSIYQITHTQYPVKRKYYCNV